MNKSVLYSIFIISIFICTLFLKKKFKPALNKNIERFETKDTKIYYHNVTIDEQGGTSEIGDSINAVSKMDKLTKNSKIFFKPQNTEYTISFFLKLNITEADNVTTIISCKKSDSNNTPLWSLQYGKMSGGEKFYIKLGNIPDKNTHSFNISAGDNNIYSIYISFKINELICWIDGESFPLQNDTKNNDIEPTIENIIIFNSDSLELHSKTQTERTSADTLNSISVSNIFVHNQYFTMDNIKTTQVCKYNPSNDSNIYECKEQCNKTPICSPEECNKICKTLEKKLHKPSPITQEPNAPKKIRVVPINQGFTIEFKKPEYEGFKAKIDKFIIIAKLLYVDIGDYTNNTRIYTFDAPNSENCKYNIEGLINSKLYNISVLSHSTNSEGVGFVSKESSEVETSQPYGDIIESHPALIETENQIKTIVESDDELLNNSKCYGDESSKYKFSSSLLDKEKIKNMYKSGGANLENIILKNINPNIENLIYDIENVNKKGIEIEEESVSIMKDWDRDFDFI
jgi:hypothetical protein